MNRRKKIVIVLCVFLIACQQKQSETKDKLTDSINETKLDSNSVSDTLTKSNQSFGEPIDINKIKRLDFLEVTSGVAGIPPDNCPRKENTFYGFYNMLNKNKNPWEQIGILVVVASGKAEKWRADTKDEIFSQIELVNSDIAVWDSIKVGTSENDLMKFIGDNFHYKKGTIIYAELGDYKGTFTIATHKISKLTVGKHCK